MKPTSALKLKIYSSYLSALLPMPDVVIFSLAQQAPEMMPAARSFRRSWPATTSPQFLLRPSKMRPITASPKSNAMRGALSEALKAALSDHPTPRVGISPGDSWGDSGAHIEFYFGNAVPTKDTRVSVALLHQQNLGLVLQEDQSPIHSVPRQPA